MQLTCTVEYFPPPDEHLFCCRKTRDCECPRRMGICADETEEPSQPETDIPDAYEIDYYNADDYKTC